MSDPLLRATKALREKYADHAAAPASTRERILERRTASLQHRRARTVLLVPLAAAFVLFATWAAATGAIQRALFGETQLERPLSSATASAAAPSGSIGPGPRATPSALAAPSEALEDASAARVVEVAPPPVAVAPPAVPPSVPPATAGAPSAPAPSAVAAPPAPSVPSAEDQAYAAAHQAHFTARDYGVALASWDRYLAAFPSGRLAPEARYNRAICLVRLGRKAEARAALEPFADGTMGGYRRAEAARLLDAL